MRWLWPVALLLCCLWHERDLVRPKAIVPALLVGQTVLTAGGALPVAVTNL